MNRKKFLLLRLKASQRARELISNYYQKDNNYGNNQQRNESDDNEPTAGTGVGQLRPEYPG